MLEKVVVDAGHLRTGGTIDEHGVEDVHADDFLLETFDVAGQAFLQTGFISLQFQPVTVEHGVVAACDAHDIELETALLHQSFPLRVNLLYKAVAHCSNAANEEIEHLVF